MLSKVEEKNSILYIINRYSYSHQESISQELINIMIAKDTLLTTSVVIVTNILFDIAIDLSILNTIFITVLPGTHFILR